MAKVITFSNQKGGVAKTTSAVMTVGNLVNRGYKVLLIDTDPQANATDFVAPHCDGTRSIYSVITGQHPVEEVIVHTEEFGDVLPSSSQLYNDEILASNPFAIKEIIDAVRNSYDYIVIDTPPNLGKVQIADILASEYLVIPTKATRESVKGIQTLIDTIYQYLEYNPSMEIVGILVTMSDKRVLAVRENMKFIKQLAESIEVAVFSNWIRAAQALVGEAELFHTNVFAQKARNKAKDDYDGFVSELLHRIERMEGKV